MRRIVAILICLVCISCKKEENTVEVIFLENLKESTKDYARDIEWLCFGLEAKYKETKVERFNIDAKELKYCKTEIDRTIDLWNSMNNMEIISSQKGLIEKLNSIGLLIKFDEIKNDKLTSLSKLLLKEYFKEKLYKVFTA